MKLPYYLISYAYDAGFGLRIDDTVIPLTVPLDEKAVGDIRAHLAGKAGVPVSIIALTKLES